MSAIADEILAARKALLDRIVDELESDARVEALWLAGSSGRGQDDALSDVDIAIVSGPEGGSLVQERFELAGRVGPLVAHLDSPHNAPPDGGQLNALYDLRPLPVWVDWNYWPATRSRPSDVLVLFERGDLRPSDDTYEDVQRGMPRGRAPERTQAHLAHFRFMMLPIVAKYAARGWADSVVGLFAVMEEPSPASTDLPTVLEALQALLARLEQNETSGAVRCVRRYLDTVGDVVL